MITLCNKALDTIVSVIGLSFERPFFLRGTNLILSRNPPIYIKMQIYVKSVDLNPLNLWIYVKSADLC